MLCKKYGGLSLHMHPVKTQLMILQTQDLQITKHHSNKYKEKRKQG